MEQTNQQGSQKKLKLLPYNFSKSTIKLVMKRLGQDPKLGKFQEVFKNYTEELRNPVFEKKKKPNVSKSWDKFPVELKLALMKAEFGRDKFLLPKLEDMLSDKVVELDLSDCKLKTKHCILLFHTIASSKRLRILNLRRNKLETMGVLFITCALFSNESLTEMDLR